MITIGVLIVTIMGILAYIGLIATEMLTVLKSINEQQKQIVDFYKSRSQS